MNIDRYAANLIVERGERDMKAIADALQRMALYAQHEGQDRIDESIVNLMLPEPLSVRL